MPHRRRIVAPGIPFHITERGVRRTAVFRDNEDHTIYLRVLKKSATMFGLTIHAYCLMPNHVHFVVTPERRDSLSRTLHRLHSAYAPLFNSKYGLAGRLWEDRPHYTAMSEGHFLNAVRYVERNPVRAGMVSRAEQYIWSSARYHCGLVSDDLVDSIWPPHELRLQWSDWLSGNCNREMDDLLRRHTLSGKPCGDDAFVLQLEAIVGLRIRPRKPGPKGSKEESGPPDF